jgi:hypothetical protein
LPASRPWPRYGEAVSSTAVSAQVAILMMVALAMVAAGIDKKRLEWRARKDRDRPRRRLFRRHDEKPS